jgi:hypothetical protein
MKLSTIVNAGILGTSVMTCFSDWLSQRRQENFVEPELLAFFYRQSALPGHQLARLAGWHFHYTAGVAWATLYAALLQKEHIANRRSTSVVLGAFSGLVALAVWQRVFATSSHKPGTSPQRFYGQLIPAHIVFACMVMEVLKHSDATHQE